MTFVLSRSLWNIYVGLQAIMNSPFNSLASVLRALTTTEDSQIDQASPTNHDSKLDLVSSNISVIQSSSQSMLTPQQNIMLPIILLLGPCGCGKGTLATRLIAQYKLYHLSVGDWLRKQTKAPILGVSDDRINDYVSLNFEIPLPWLTQSYGEAWMENAPPPLILYVCSKANKSTPSSMWIRSMANLKQECLMVSQQSKADAILLDNFPKTIQQSDALDRCFGRSNLPVLAISLTCPLDVNLKRFLARSRGQDNVDTFRRRLERFDKESPAVIRKYKNACKLVEVSSLGTPDEVFQKVVSECEKSEIWSNIFVDHCVRADSALCNEG